MNKKYKQLFEIYDGHTIQGIIKNNINLKVQIHSIQRIKTFEVK